MDENDPKYRTAFKLIMEAKNYKLAGLLNLFREDKAMLILINRIIAYNVKNLGDEPAGYCDKCHLYHVTGKHIL